MVNGGITNKMAAIPQNTNKVEYLIDRQFEAKPEHPRPHLGCSQLGNDCERALWYGFRWASVISFPGRIKRLFRRGHHEENWFVSDLKNIGIQVLERDPNTGKQFRYSDIGGHLGGSADGLALGVPEAPKTPHILEFKTHAEKSFKDLIAKGVKESKPVHWAQMQLYMHFQGFDRALYLAVNKNTDALYSERVKLDQSAADALLDKGRRVITATTPPPRISNDPSFYGCKFCDHYDVCHGQKTAEVNCRTCISSTPELTGDKAWSCDCHNINPNVDQQREGCPTHRFIPDLLPFAELTGGDQDARRLDYRVIATDQPFSNGESRPDDDRPSYSSSELCALDPAAIGDPGIEAMREHFEAKITNHGVEGVDYESVHTPCQ